MAAASHALELQSSVTQRKRWRACVQEEHSGRRLVYRLVVLAVEAAFGASAIGAVISRSRRQRLEGLRRAARDRPWLADDLLTILYVTDEDARAICASVDSHYGAARPGLPLRCVLVAERAGPAAAVTAAYEQLRGAHPNLLLFTKEELAQQVRARAQAFRVLFRVRRSVPCHAVHNAVPPSTLAA